MASYIGRRKFLATLGGAPAWPLPARAQQPGKTPRVGYIRAGTPRNDPFREEFVRGMRDAVARVLVEPMRKVLGRPAVIDALLLS